jgi:hypothetical protein
MCKQTTNKLLGFWSAKELYRLSDRHWLASFSANTCGQRGVCRMVGAADLHTVVNLEFSHEAKWTSFQTYSY